MKRIVVFVLAAAMVSSTASAEINSDLSRAIEKKVEAAEQKVAVAAHKFNRGDANGGCKVLVSAARDLDASIDAGIRLIDRTQNNRTIGENGWNVTLINNMETRLQSIVDMRSLVQTELEQRCTVA